MLIICRMLFLLVVITKLVMLGFCPRKDPCKAVGPYGYADMGTVAAA